MPFDVVPRSQGFGALVQTDDSASLLEERARERLNDALSRFGVLVFLGLMADDDMHVALTGIFGEVQTFGAKKIFRSANFDEDGALFRPDSDKARLLRLNWLWHSDGVYRERGIRAVLLRAETIVEGLGFAGAERRDHSEMVETTLAPVTRNPTPAPRSRRPRRKAQAVR